MIIVWLLAAVAIDSVVFAVWVFVGFKEAALLFLAICAGLLFVGLAFECFQRLITWIGDFDD